MTYTNGKVWVIGGGFREQSSWSNNTKPAAEDSQEIGNSMQLDLVSGAWTDLDSKRTVVAAMFGMCSLEITCPTEGMYGKGFCAYSPPWSYMQASPTGTCGPCWDFYSADDCEWAFQNDETSKSACKSTCHGVGNAGGTGGSTAATFRYGHGLAPGRLSHACMVACWLRSDSIYLLLRAVGQPGALRRHIRQP